MLRRKNWLPANKNMRILRQQRKLLLSECILSYNSSSADPIPDKLPRSHHCNTETTTGFDMRQ
jgi:hypothetical protein